MTIRVNRPAQQDWVCKLPIMQQSVLFSAVRAPDGIPKNHPVKALLRWYRRSILLSAFDGRPLLDPFSPGGGSFTGPFTRDHATAIFGHFVVEAFEDDIEDENEGNPLAENEEQMMWQFMLDMKKVYLQHVDELPHHFQLHFMHAAQIVGVHHPDVTIAEYWRDFYEMIVNDAHLHPETDEEMNLRLSDNPQQWRAREGVTAK